MEYKTLHGEILKFIFNQYSFVNAEFAEELSIDDSTIRTYLSGSRLPKADNANKLYKFLAKKIDEADNAASDKTVADFIVSKGASVDNYTYIHESHGKYFANVLSTLRTTARTGKSSPPKAKHSTTGRTLLVVFDFDGTLAQSYWDKTTWETLWELLGYDVTICKNLHKQFNNHEFDHQTWCDKTAEYFKCAHFNRQMLQRIAVNIHLINGVRDTFDALNQKNIKIAIASGSILELIKTVLNGLDSLVDRIEANQFIFDINGELSQIRGTLYDFEGKELFISKFADELGIATEDVLFVGNSYNDHSAHKSGAKTLCINPKQTTPTDKKYWDDYIDECSSLTQILSYVI